MAVNPPHRDPRPGPRVLGKTLPRHRQCQRRRAYPLVLILAMLAASSAWPSPARGQAASHWLAGGYVDYAPMGMPDFSQCRGAWSAAGAPPQWTHAGPVALANLLWWLDSRAETDPAPPDRHADSHGLVTAYPVFGPQPDDHAQANLTPLVEDLALRAKTNGLGQAGSGPPTRGTRWELLVKGLSDYLESRRVDEDYQQEVSLEPSPAWLHMRVEQDAGILLYLGVWERQGEAWQRIGGHYAAVAGAGPGQIALSDPLADAASNTGRGRAIPEDEAFHGCRSAPAAHDDAANLSHDLYTLENNPALPRSTWLLSDYFNESNWGEAAAFQAQNPADFLKGETAPWLGGEVVMSVDAAIALIPIHPAGSGPTASPSPSPSATPTQTHAATASPSPSRTRPSASPTATSTTDSSGSNIFLPSLSAAP